MSLDEKLLALLYAAPLQTLPESELLRRSGTSLNEILASLKNLQELGYLFEIRPQAGYRLVASPDALMAEDLRARLQSRADGQIGSRILVFEKTASTNDIVQRMALEGTPEGLVVFAESQSTGRGRFGRNWISPPRKGLWFTVLLRPQMALQSVQRLTLMAAVATVASLRKCTGLPLKIKWPNDILCNERKLVGILVELGADGAGVGDGIRHASIGIGINVNLEASDFPEWLRPQATSLKQEFGRAFHRPALAVEILRELEQCRALLLDENAAILLERWIELDGTLGRQISVMWNGGMRLQGLASHLDPDGALLIRTDEGRMERLTAGEVTFQKEMQ